VRDAVGAEDRMQAFLWRHLVPAQELMALVHDKQAQDKKPWKRRRKSEALSRFSNVFDRESLFFTVASHNV